MLQVTWLVLTNQSAIFQNRLGSFFTLKFFIILAPDQITSDVFKWIHLGLFLFIQALFKQVLRQKIVDFSGIRNRVGGVGGWPLDHHSYCPKYSKLLSNVVFSIQWFPARFVLTATVNGAGRSSIGSTITWPNFTFWRCRARFKPGKLDSNCTHSWLDFKHYYFARKTSKYFPRKMLWELSISLL